MSILKDVKTSLGIPSELTAFDDDLKLHINSELMTLNQIGIGPKEGFMVVSGEEEWSELTDRTDITAIKQYVYLRVRIVFDPPSNSSVQTAMETKCSELIFRLNVQAETEDPKTL